jgi:hypothetical protein
MMLTTVGRGGDGQRIRDEILHIMHRNHIPETKGNWMEEWHQKLHNNTTPDDVPICQAYIAFLEANGDHSAYWRVLSDAGITRQRLEGFDRWGCGLRLWLGSLGLTLWAVVVAWEAVFCSDVRVRPASRHTACMHACLHCAQQAHGHSCSLYQQPATSPPLYSTRQGT